MVGHASTEISHARTTPARPVSKFAPPLVREVVATPGRPLEPGIRPLMERRLGHDFSRVRIHADARAADSAAAVSASAYTVGDHVVFAANRYAPRTPGGVHLLAHELAHVRQQAGAHPSGADALRIGAADSALEREAGASADALVAGTPHRPGGRTATAHLQRHPDDLVAYTGGQSGRVLVFEAGTLAYVGPAVSGHPGGTEWEPNVGPTPSGMYAIHPGITRSPVTKAEGGVCGAKSISSGYQEITATDTTPCAAGSAHYCNVACPTTADPGQLCWTPRDCWGPKRIRIEGGADVPKAGGSTVHRDGFYLHGGNPADPVSSGCVKSLNDDAFDAIRKLTGTKGRVRFCAGTGCPPNAQVAAASVAAVESVQAAIGAIRDALP